MNDHLQNQYQCEAAEACASTSPAVDSVSSRRKLLKAGVSAAPIVLTLASRPVLAWHCKTPSVAASANLSHTVVTVADEGTKTITYWQRASTWPNFDRNNVTLKGMFGGSDTTKCKVAISDTAHSTLVKYLIAAMLNIQPSVSTAGQCLTAAQIKLMYQNGPSGNYDPIPGSGIHWGSTQIINYLQTNWIVTGF